MLSKIINYLRDTIFRYHFTSILDKVYERMELHTYFNEKINV